MELIFAVVMCMSTPQYSINGCELSSWPSIFRSKGECEHQRDLMNGGYRTEPKNGLLYECWAKEVPAWRPVR